MTMLQNNTICFYRLNLFENYTNQFNGVAKNQRQLNKTTPNLKPLHIKRIKTNMEITIIEENLKDEMLSSGVTPPHNFIADGKIHRFHVEGDKRDTND